MSGSGNHLCEFTRAVFYCKRTIASTCSYASFSAIIVSHDTESKKVEHLTFLTDYGGQTMSSQTSLVADQVRLRQWAAQIQECQSRPADMKVETWCSEHGITKANYYYRLRRVRKLDGIRRQLTTGFTVLIEKA